MKKFTYIVTMFIILLGIKTTANASDYTFGDFTYRVENDFVVITGYTGNGGEIVIPDRINGYTVKTIGEDAFYDNADITKVIMPNSITHIDSYAFASCVNLEEVVLSKSLQVISEGGFANSSKLREITLPATISTVGRVSFSYSSSLEAINVDKEGREGFFSIDGVLFFNGVHAGNQVVALVAYPGNRNGTTYVVPDFVTYIRSFSYIQNLERLVIPASVTTIELNSILMSEKSIDIILKHEKVPSIGTQAFNSLAAGSRIVCKNEEVREEAQSSIKGNGVTAVLATNADLIEAEDLQLTSASEITIDPRDTVYVQWKQLPEDTTENVTWESSDKIGLTIEPLTGKIEAIYRGTYFVTGRDESGHTISVKVTVSTLLDNGEIIFDSRQSGSWQNHVGMFYVGETYKLGFYSTYEQGIYPGTDMTIDWTISGVRELNTSGETLFTPYQSGSYTIMYVKKDIDGVLLAQDEVTINVVRDESKLLELSEYFGELNQYHYSYTGKEIKPSIKGGNITLVNKDYYSISYEQNIKPGIGYVVFTGRYGAKGKLKIPFYIDHLPTRLTGTERYTKRHGDKAFTLNTKANAGQKLKYVSSNRKVAIVSDKGKVTIMGAGTAVITVRVSGDALYENAEKKVTIIAAPCSINKVSLTIKSGRRKATLSWKKVKNASGYEIRRSTSKKGKYSKIKTITKTSSKSFTDKKVSVKKTYHYKVRAYRTINGKKVYGSYSNVKSVRIKK